MESGLGEVGNLKSVSKLRLCYHFRVCCAKLDSLESAPPAYLPVRCCNSF